MQASCPNCQQKIVIDDARVPDRPFSVKCPKCQTVVKLPGKGQAAAAPAESEAPEPASSEARAQPPVQPSAVPGSLGRALVALPDRNVAAAISQTLGRLGFSVEALEDWEEGARLLEQGAFGAAVTARVGGAQGKESLYQRINRLGPDARRRVFLVLVGDEFKTGDGTQAWVCMADFVVNNREAAQVDHLFRLTYAERNRIYQMFVDAKQKNEEANV